MRTTLLATALTLVSLLPAGAATVTDPGATATLFAGDLFAEASAPLSDIAGFAPTHALISGGVSGFDPAFVLSLETAAGEVLYGEADSYAFDGTDLLTFLFSVTGSATALFGDTVAVTLTLAESIAQPFDLTTDRSLGASFVIASPDVAPVPLPATAPLLLAALASAAAIARRRRRA